MAAKKISRKELLKEPDEFLTTSAKVLQFIQGNPRVGVIACVLVLAVVVAVVAAYGYLEGAKNTSHDLFEKAYRSYRAAVFSEKPVPPEKWDRLFKLFNIIAEEYPSWPAGESALLYSGHVLYEKKEYKAALERYDRMRSTELVKSGLGGLVMYHRGMTLLAMKKFEPAVTILEELTKDPNSPYRREAFASIAGVYETMGKKKEAIQTFRQYLKMFPKAPDAALVKARIAKLDAGS